MFVNIEKVLAVEIKPKYNFFKAGQIRRFNVGQSEFQTRIQAKRFSWKNSGHQEFAWLLKQFEATLSY